MQTCFLSNKHNYRLSYFILKGNQAQHYFFFIVLLLLKGNHVIHSIFSIFLCIGSNIHTFEELSRYVIPPYAFFHFGVTWYSCFLGYLYLDICFWNGQFMFNISKYNINGKGSYHVCSKYDYVLLNFLFQTFQISFMYSFMFNMLVVGLKCHGNLCCQI